MQKIERQYSTLNYFDVRKTPKPLFIHGMYYCCKGTCIA